ncbi:T9SS type A sorting domain-containing protein [Wenyingzhuangia sp. IMCC45574]
MKKIKKLMLAVVLTVGVVNAQVAEPCNMDATNENQFYKGPNPSGNVTLYPSGIEDSSDSDALQQLINDNPGKKIKLLASGANKIFYFKDVEIKSNTHIRVGSSVVLRTNRNGLANNKNAVMFTVGKTGDRVKNFSFTSNGDENDITKRFTVEMRQLTPLVKTGTLTKTDAMSGESFITVANAGNFKIANFNIDDNYSRISTLTFSFNDAGEKNHFKSILDTSAYPDQDRTPEQGVIKNITATKGHAGYGIVQIQAAVGLLFKNLDGTGGVPLRVETGLNTAIITKDKTVDGVYGRNIRAKNGLSCVDISPHNVEQGCIDMEDVYSESSVFTVRLDKGFEDDKDMKVSDINLALMGDATFNALVTSKQFEKFNSSGNSVGFYVYTKDINTFLGTFNSVKLKKIEGKGGEKAQVKSKFYKFYDEVTKNDLVSDKASGLINDDMETVSGKTLSVIKYSADPSLDECNCGGNTPSENGCFEVSIAKTNNSFVKLRRGGNGLSTIGIPKVLVDGPDSFYKLSDHTSTSVPGWTNSERPSLISTKVLDGLFGATSDPCPVTSPKTAENVIVSNLEFNNERGLSIYPNPTSGVVHVNSELGDTIKVYNSSGVLIESIIGTQSKINSIDLSIYGSGVYFVSIHKSDGVTVKKIIKK